MCTFILNFYLLETSPTQIIKITCHAKIYFVIKVSFTFVLEKAKKTKRSKRPDVMSYLAEKKEADITFKGEELKYNRDALESETKLRQEALDVEKRRIALQEQQMAIQLELLKAFVNNSKK